jgi:glucose/arabinose dehydrogenase
MILARSHIRAFALSLLLLLPLVLVACSDDSEDGDGGGGSGETFGFGLGAEVLTTEGTADRVSAMEFAPDGRLFYAEQLKGTIRIIGADGVPVEAPFAQLTVADWAGLDWGLTGLALDPEFATNGYVYAFYSELVTPGAPEASPSVNPTARPVLVRFTDQGGVGVEQTVLSSDFPETSPGKAGFNANGEIHFGPDGMLYASVGDYDLFEDDPDIVTSLDTPIGKMLRLNPDGTAAEDNPFVDQEGADPRIFATGFREPFPFTFANDGTLYGTDNTTVSCEELNVVTAGLDYGWPQMGKFPFSDCAAAPGAQPIYNMARDGMTPDQFVSFVEVSGLSSLTGSSYSQLEDSLMVCESRKSADAQGQVQSGVLKRMLMSDPNTVTSYDQVSSVCFGEVRIRDGVVYYATQSAIQRLIEGGAASEGDNGDGEGDGGDDQPPPTPPGP